MKTRHKKEDIILELNVKEAEFISNLRKLSFFNRTTETILKGENREQLKRHFSVIKSKVSDAYNLIHDMQCMKIDLDESEEAIDEWTQERNDQILLYENVAKNIEEILSAEEESEKQKQNNERIEFEAMLRATVRKDEEQAEIARRLREEKFALELEEKRQDMAEKRRIQAKLPDLHITKFQGTYLDWTRFWGLFETQIDQASMKDEAKFSYLKELVVPKVSQLIDKLPVNSNGYKQAKKILIDRYGDDSEVVHAHVQEILSLPTIHGVSKVKIHNFYELLLSHVQALETLGRLCDVAGNVRVTLDKLEGIRADLIRSDANWKAWKFPDLVEALKQWAERNPLQQGEKDAGQNVKDARREKAFWTGSQEKLRQCVYCEKDDHRSVECPEVHTVDQRKKILSTKRLCFNCTGEKHRASECRSKANCRNCQRRHHSSICDRSKEASSSTKVMTEASGKDVVYPVVVIYVEGIKCRALLDTGSGSSYASSTLLDLVKKDPVRQEVKTIEMMLCTTKKTINVYDLEISDVDKHFNLSCEVNRVEKDVLLTLPNPRYDKLISKNGHLKGIKMHDTDVKDFLPIHLILGANEYSRIKTTTPAKIGIPGQPVAEKTEFGWVVMSPGKESQLSPLMFARDSHDDYMQLCSLDILGLEDRREGDQERVFEEFKEQLCQREDGKYETALPWKPNHSHLPTNYQVASSRLQSLLKRLEKQPDLFNTYDEIIQDQLREGIVETVPDQASNHEHYIPHKPVIRQNAETTKVRIVYDASAKVDSASPSLNDCLDTGPPLQGKLLDILLRVRMRPVLLAGDIKQAFLQIVIRETERDALRFLWLKDSHHKEITAFRVTRALFGLAPSPFLLGGTLKVHLQKFAKKYPDCVKELQDGTYVDDLNLGGNTHKEVNVLKKTAIHVMNEGGFQLHKWHSNVEELESDQSEDRENTYAKSSLGTKSSECKLLGVPWNKRKDTMSVIFPKSEEQSTKRVLLRTIAKVYDPLGITAPLMLTAKTLYRDTCDAKVGWDKILPDCLKAQWEKWLQELPDGLTIPRCIPRLSMAITHLELHGFADASAGGCCAVIFAVVEQSEEVSQGILVSKARLAKRDLTIPRLELVSCHMVSNLLLNTATALSNLPVKELNAWTDSTTCLHWIKGAGEYKQFVANRVAKINKAEAVWRYVPSEANPADFGSRGTVGISKHKSWETWLNGPSWLSQKEEWPEQIVTIPSKDSESEKLKIKEIMKTTVVNNPTVTESLIAKFKLSKAVRIMAWIHRFINNCRTKKKNYGSLVTEETHAQLMVLIKEVQEDAEKSEVFESHLKFLNLMKNPNGIYECRGRIQGEYPVYLPPKCTLSQKIVESAHLKTLHGGVSLTMAKVREEFWIPKLRSLVKQVIKSCYGCKRFHAKHIAQPSQGNLPKERSEGHMPFEVTGVDHAGPIYYKLKQKTDSKAYILLFSCYSSLLQLN